MTQGILTISGSLAFGSHPVDEVGCYYCHKLYFTLTNTGTKAILIYGMSAALEDIGGTGENDVFVPNTNSYMGIQPGASLTFRVAFTPAEQKTYSGVLTIPGNYSNQPITIAVSGTGT